MIHFYTRIPIPDSYSYPHHAPHPSNTPKTLPNTTQEEALLTLAVLASAGFSAACASFPVFRKRVLPAMRQHPLRGGVQRAGCLLLAALAGNRDPEVAVTAARFSNELLFVLRVYSDNAPVAAARKRCPLFSRLTDRSFVGFQRLGEWVFPLLTPRCASLQAACHALLCIVRSCAPEAEQYVRPPSYPRLARPSTQPPLRRCGVTPSLCA